MKSGIRQQTRCATNKPKRSSTAQPPLTKLLRVPPAIEIPLNIADNHRRIRHHDRQEDLLHVVRDLRWRSPVLLATSTVNARAAGAA